VSNRSPIIDRYKDYDDRILANELVRYAEICRREYTYRHTDFLDPRQQKIAEDVLREFSDVEYEFNGGIEGSERCICLLRNENYENHKSLVPISILLISWDVERRKLTHRDFLGSIIGSGIKREKIGDIILHEGKAYVACLSDIARYLLSNIERIGSTSVRISETEEAIRKEEKTRILSTTVASLRLDSIIGSGFGFSRSKAVEMVKVGKVRVNWEEEGSPSKEVKQGDVISLRGKGRIILEEITGTTKKDRIKIMIRKYQ
jgi:RNA-binding protein YlmH